MPRRKKTTPAEPPAEVRNAELERDIAEDFQERQNLNATGSEELAEKLREHHSLSPDLSAGDVDAAWDTARESGEETFTGHAPTPDQDEVDAQGAAAGLSYRDDEPLQYGKVARRDERRWELDARSGAEEQALDETEDEADADDDEADEDDAPLRFWDLADDLDAEVEEEYDDEDEDDEEAEDEEDAGADDEDDDTVSLLEEEDELDAEEEDAEDVEDDLDDTDGADFDDEDFEEDLDLLDDDDEDDDDDD